VRPPSLERQVLGLKAAVDGAEVQPVARVRLCTPGPVSAEVVAREQPVERRYRGIGPGERIEDARHRRRLTDESDEGRDSVLRHEAVHAPLPATGLSVQAHDARTAGHHQHVVTLQQEGTQAVAAEVPVFGACIEGLLGKHVRRKHEAEQREHQGSLCRSEHGSPPRPGRQAVCSRREPGSLRPATAF